MGIIVETTAVFLAGIIGSALGKVLPEDLTQSILKIFGFCAITMGIASVVQMENLSVVILSIIIGYIIGWFLKIETFIKSIINIVISKFALEDRNESRIQLYCTCLMIVCFSGTGIYGALVDGISNDNSILFAKALLDFFTILILATKLGKTTSSLVIPQFLFLGSCYLIAKLTLGNLPTMMINNFKAVGGVITMIVGYNMLVTDENKIYVLDTIPALAVVFAISKIMMMF